MNTDLLLSSIQVFIYVYPCAWLCWLPFAEKLKCSARRYALLTTLLCLICSVISAATYVYLGIDESGNIAIVIFLPLMFMFYRKNIDEDLQKLLFVFFMVLHGATVFGGIEQSVYMLSNIQVEGVSRTSQPLGLILNFSRIAYYIVLGLVINRVFTPRLRNIDSQNIKGLWIIPVSFSSIAMFYGTYSFMRSVSDIVFPITFISLAVMSFAIYGLILGILDNVAKNAQTAAEATARERTNELKTELTRAISHEMRTPLSVIKGYAEISAKEARKTGITDEILDNLDVIAEEASRLADLAEEMRQHTIAKEYHVDMHAVDMDSVIRQVAGLYAKNLERKGVSLKCQTAGVLPPVSGNEPELKQVIFNLLRNAEQHTQEGSVTVAAELRGQSSVMVTVSDTGSGIAPEILERVFERGFSADKDGSGYGLSISRDIITAYGGEIWAESDGKSGTSVIFTLPVHEENKQ